MCVRTTTVSLASVFTRTTGRAFFFHRVPIREGGSGRLCGNFSERSVVAAVISARNEAIVRHFRCLFTIHRSSRRWEGEERGRGSFRRTCLVRCASPTFATTTCFVTPLACSRVQSSSKSCSLDHFRATVHLSYVSSRDHLSKLVRDFD